MIKKHPLLQNSRKTWRVSRYLIAVFAAAAGLWLRESMTALVGPGLPVYITFYPAVITIALLMGPGPGLLATFASGIIVVYRILPPVGQFSINTPLDRLGLAIFITMGLFLSAIAEFYRRKTSAFERSKALIESEKKYRPLIEHAPVGISEIDLTEKKFISVNEGMCRMLGYTEKELLCMTPEDVLGKEAWNRCFESTEAIPDGEFTAGPIEFSTKNRDGGTIWGILHMKFMYSDGIISGAFVVVHDITERKKFETELDKVRTETELREAELKIILDTAPVGIWIAHDPECRLITGNRYADERIMNVNRGSNVSASALPGDAAVSYRVFKGNLELKPEELPAQVAAATGKPVPDVILELKFSDGNSKYIYEGAFPLFDAKGNVRGAIATAIDVTPLRAFQVALIESEERFRTIAETVPVLVSITRIEDSTIMFTNESNSKAFGIDSVNIIGTRGPDYYFNPDDRIRIEELFKKQGFVNSYQLKVRRTDGTPFWILSSLRPIVYRDKQAIISASIDITEYKNVESALRKSEERYRTIVETANEGIWAADGENKTTFVNGRMAEMLGYKAEELIGRPTSDFHDMDQEEIILKTTNDLQSGIKTHQELKLIRKDGSNLWVISSASPVTDIDGKLIGTISLLTDITERKIMEDEMHHYINELSLANKDLESFTYSISHDLRSPLRAMKGLCGIFIEDYTDKVDAEAIDYIRRIMESTDKMSSLIDDMLNLSKVSRQETTFEEVNLSELAGAIVADLRRNEKSHKIETVISEDMKTMGDSHLLLIALSNLIGNAWKYSARTAGARIEIAETEKDGRRLYYIRDNGAGFDMKYSDKLFMPFKRLHSDRDFPGTGIGLAIVKRVIEKHGGKIWAESSPGEGATFYFMLDSNKQ